jgi:mannose-1-phosphate guanylyltransferase
MLLAAGLGTRLKPLTDSIPKCLLPICGHPLLGIWLAELEDAGVDEVLINTHHHADQVREFVGAYQGKMGIQLSYEPVLLGSAGTLVANRDMFREERDFLVCYADNLIDAGLGKLMDRRRHSNQMATIGLFRADRPREAGIVGLDADGVMVSFVEKPEKPVSNLANAGLYVFSPEVIELATFAPPADIGFDLLPLLVGRARGVVLDGSLLDIGTPDRYEQAQIMWREKMSRDHH